MLWCKQAETQPTRGMQRDCAACEHAPPIQLDYSGPPACARASPSAVCPFFTPPTEKDVRLTPAVADKVGDGATDWPVLALALHAQRCWIASRDVLPELQPPAPGVPAELADHALHVQQHHLCLW